VIAPRLTVFLRDAWFSDATGENNVHYCIQLSFSLEKLGDDQEKRSTRSSKNQDCCSGSMAILRKCCPWVDEHVKTLNLLANVIPALDNNTQGQAAAGIQ
jgi:hypothetical protein